MTSYIKKALHLVAFITTIILLSSCNFSQKPQDTRDVAREHNETVFDSKKQEIDAQFIVKATEINMVQIQLGQLAQQRGQTMDVKELGKKLEESYTQSQIDLTVLAGSKRITIPTLQTDDVRNAYEELNDKPGNEFDKAYADMMVSRHRDAIETFEDATTDRYDTEINNWAIATLHDLRTNLNLSIDCQRKCEELK